MEEITISDFKAKCIRLLKDASRTGNGLVVTLRGVPIAKVVGLPPRNRRIIGGQAGMVRTLGADDEIWIDSDFESDWES